MKRLLLVFAAVLFFPTASQAQNDLGVGVILGEPTGLSAKLWVSDSNAFDAGLAWSFANDTSIQMHADYLYHRVHFFDKNDFEGRVPVYFGLGGRMILDDDSRIGVRFPVGVGHTLQHFPIELFAEIVPILDIAPDTDFDLNGAVGIRYYLNQ